MSFAVCTNRNSGALAGALLCAVATGGGGMNSNAIAATATERFARVRCAGDDAIVRRAICLPPLRSDGALIDRQRGALPIACYRGVPVGRQIGVHSPC